jgi:hypothetical protein
MRRNPSGHAAPSPWKTSRATRRAKRPGLKQRLLPGNRLQIRLLAGTEREPRVRNRIRTCEGVSQQMFTGFPQGQGPADFLVFKGQPSPGLPLLGGEVLLVAAQAPQPSLQVGSRPLQGLAGLVDGFPGHDHDVVAVVDDAGLGEAVEHAPAVAVEHVHDDVGDLFGFAVAGPQGLPELVDGLAAPAFG